MSIIQNLKYHVVAAPMAGGPSTPALVRAVGEAGGVGFLALGTASIDAARTQLREMGEGDRLPYGVNLFARQETAPAPADIDRVHQLVLAEYEQAGRTPPEVPQLDLSNGWEDKWEALLEAPHLPAIVSSTFGCMSAAEVRQLHERNIEAWCTVTQEDEAAEALSRGVDGLIVQGPEAGGHRGVWQMTAEPDPRPLQQLVADIHDAYPAAPLIAAGGMSSAESVARALDWPGVVAVAAGSAFLRCPEAGTSAANRDLLAEVATSANHAEDGEDPTLCTRAFSGRWARGLRTEFCRAHPDPSIPPVYPALNAMLGPLRASAAKNGDHRWAYCLAGSHCAQAEEKPAGEIVQELAGAEGTDADVAVS